MTILEKLGINHSSFIPLLQFTECGSAVVT